MSIIVGDIIIPIIFGASAIVLVIIIGHIIAVCTMALAGIDMRIAIVSGLRLMKQSELVEVSWEIFLVV